MDELKLSILIPTVNGREEKLAKLLSILEPQIEDANNGNRGKVELIIAKDNKEISIGMKRHNLLVESKGEYVVFVDDDDLVSLHYVKEILKNLGADCVGFLIECTFDGQNRCWAKASLKYRYWGEYEDGFRYVRSPYHKTPIKRDIALEVGFKDKRFAEDHDYSMGLVGKLKTENFINKILYYYQYSSSEPFNQKYGIK